MKQQRLTITVDVTIEYEDDDDYLRKTTAMDDRISDMLLEYQANDSVVTTTVNND